MHRRPLAVVFIDWYQTLSKLDAAERIGMRGRLVTAESTLVHHLVDLLQMLR